MNIKSKPKESSGVEPLLSRLKSYSEEFNLDLRKSEDRFKWFLASVLFAKRISSEIAKRTYRRFEEEGLTTPERILEAEWDRLVEVLDSGGYVRYDFSTASNLLESMGMLLADYGDLGRLHEASEGSRDLERRLMKLKGVGPVCANIFLREMRGIWEKADPLPSEMAKSTGRRLGLEDVRLHESALVRLNLEYCKRWACGECMFKDLCLEAMEKGAKPRT